MVRSVHRTRSRRMKFCVHGGLGDTLNKQRRKPNGYPGALLANVFSNTLGFIRQRKREFARYMSIGMTPEGMRKMFRIEALVIAGRPVLITLPITVLFVWFMITASYLNPIEFLSVAPIVPIVIFIAAIFGFVALAYYVGGKKILKCNLAEALQNDYMG